MKANIGTTDRIVRTAIGATLVGYGLMRRNWIGALGLYPLITGILGTCPAYTAMGISTTKPAEEDMMEDHEETELAEVAVP